jgi:adenylate cyclase
MMGAVHGMSREFHRIYADQQQQLADETRDTTFAPTEGRIAVLFTDIQDSTKLWGNVPLSMGAALDIHHAVIRGVIAEHEAFEVKTAGDSFMIAVGDAERAMRVAIDVQLALMAVPFPAAIAAVYAAENDDELDAIDDDPEQLAAPSGAWNGPRVRVGAHCGPMQVVFDEVTKGYDYYGPDVNIAARVEAVATGGQICCTRAFVEAQPLAAAGHTTRRLGMRALKGVPLPTEVFEVMPAALLGLRKYSTFLSEEEEPPGSDHSGSSSNCSDASDTFSAFNESSTDAGADYAAFVAALFSAFRRTDDRNAALGLILASWRLKRLADAPVETTYGVVAKRVTAAVRKQRRRARGTVPARSLSAASVSLTPRLLGQLGDAEAEE